MTEGLKVVPTGDGPARSAMTSRHAAPDASRARTGANSRTLVEGRVSAADVSARALAATRGADAVADAQSDGSFGALRLIDPTLRLRASLDRMAPLAGDISDHRTAWRRDVRDVELAA